MTPMNTTANTNPNGLTEMNLLHENLARAQMSERLGEAQQLRQGRRLARARRLSRKAERAAQQARLALARAL
jgi:hypothetical protein